MGYMDEERFQYFKEHYYNPAKKDPTMTQLVGLGSDGKLWEIGRAHV